MRMSRALLAVLSVGAVVFGFLAISRSLGALVDRLRGRRSVDAMRRGDSTDRARSERALDGVTVNIDPRKYKHNLKPVPDDFDLAEFRRTMPVFNPPLSQTIIDERESYQT